MKGTILFLVLLITASSVYAAESIDKEASQTRLTKDISIPEGLRSTIISVFKTPPDYTFSLSSVILLLTIFAVIFIVLMSMIELLPFIEGKKTRVVVAMIISLITAISGGIYEAFNVLGKFSSRFNDIGNWDGIGTIILFTVLIIIAVIIKVVAHGLKRILNKEEARASGFIVGKKVAESSIFSKIFREK